MRLKSGRNGRGNPDHGINYNTSVIRQSSSSPPQPCVDTVRECQIRQCKRGEITLVVVPKETALSAEQKRILAAGPRRCWGSRFAIEVHEAAPIERLPGGKRRFVVSELLAPR
jgi:hypothetical protein